MKIHLRKLKDDDYISLARYANNKKIWNNLRDMMPHPYTEEDARRFIEMKKDQKEDYVFVIEYEGRLAGMIGLHPQGDIYRKSFELGYWVAEEFWGGGIATDAVKQILAISRSMEGYNRVFAGVLAHNEASKAILLRNGFQMGGIARQAAFKNGKVVDEWKYAYVWS